MNTGHTFTIGNVHPHGTGTHLFLILGYSLQDVKEDAYSHIHTTGSLF